MSNDYTVMATFIVRAADHAWAVRTLEEWLTGTPSRTGTGILAVRVTPAGQFPIDAPSGWLKHIATLEGAVRNFVKVARADVDPNDTTSIVVTDEYRALVNSWRIYEDFTERRGRPPAEPAPEPMIDYRAVAVGLTETLSAHETAYTDLLKVLESVRAENSKLADELVRQAAAIAEFEWLTGSNDDRLRTYRQVGALQGELDALHATRSGWAKAAEDAQARERVALKSLKANHEMLTRCKTELRDTRDLNNVLEVERLKLVGETIALKDRLKAATDRQSPLEPVGSEAMIQGLKYLNAELNSQQGLLNDQIARLKADAERAAKTITNADAVIKKEQERNKDMRDKNVALFAETVELRNALEHERKDHADAETRLFHASEELTDLRGTYNDYVKDSTAKIEAYHGELAVARDEAAGLRFRIGEMNTGYANIQKENAELAEKVRDRERRHKQVVESLGELQVRYARRDVEADQLRQDLDEAKMKLVGAQKDNVGLERRLEQTIDEKNAVRDLATRRGIERDNAERRAALAERFIGENGLGPRYWAESKESIPSYGTETAQAEPSPARDERRGVEKLVGADDTVWFAHPADPAGTVRIVHTGGTHSHEPGGRPIQEPSQDAPGRSRDSIDAARASDGEQSPGTAAEQPDRDQEKPDRDDQPDRGSARRGPGYALD